MLDSFVPHVSFIYNNPANKIPEEIVKKILAEKIYAPFVTTNAQFDISEKPLNVQPMQIPIVIIKPEDLFMLSNALNTVVSLSFYGK